MRKHIKVLILSLLSITCAMILSSFSTSFDNNVTKLNIHKDTTTSILLTSTMKLKSSEFTFDKVFQFKILDYFERRDSIDHALLDIEKQKVELINLSNSALSDNPISVIDRVLSYYGYTDKDLIRKARCDVMIKNTLLWLILTLILLIVYYLKITSKLNPNENWKSSLVYYLFTITILPVLYYCLYGLLSGLFNSDYQTILNLINLTK